MAKSHPTYNVEHIKWGQKPKLTPEERVKQIKALDPYSKEGQELQEYHAIKNGYEINTRPKKYDYTIKKRV